MPTHSRSHDFIEAATPWLLALLAAAAAVGGLLRVFAINEPILTRLDDTTLVYFAVAGALLLLRNVKTLAFGDFKVEMERMKAIAEEAKDAARAAGDAVIYGSVPGPVQSQVSRAERVPVTAGIAAERSVAVESDVGGLAKVADDSDDPWRNQFGKASSSGTRRLRATVTPMSGRTDWYSVRLIVESTSPRKAPLTGAVQFYLHPTFANNQPVVPVGSNGKAELTLVAWGAFTVGAIADSGATELELDLADLEDAPQEFRDR